MAMSWYTCVVVMLIIVPLFACLAKVEYKDSPLFSDFRNVCNLNSSPKAHILKCAGVHVLLVCVFVPKDNDCILLIHLEGCISLNNAGGKLSYASVHCRARADLTPAIPLYSRDHEDVCLMSLS